jgi:hypothetical protein
MVFGAALVLDCPTMKEFSTVGGYLVKLAR